MLTMTGFPDDCSITWQSRRGEGISKGSTTTRALLLGFGSSTHPLLLLLVPEACDDHADMTAGGHDIGNQQEGQKGVEWQ